MKRETFSLLTGMAWIYFAVAFAISSLAVSALGAEQNTLPAVAPTTTTTGAQTIVPQLIKFSGTLTDLAGKPVSGPVDVTFSLYSEESGGTPLWYESQTVNADAAGQYTALLGAMTTTGVPMDLFASGQARWLGVAVRGLPEQSRVLLVSVPYAMTSGNAEMLGGKPASDYLLASSLSSTTNATNAAAVTAATTAGRASTTGLARNSRQMSITTGGTANYLAGWVDGTNLGTSVVYQNPTTNNIGIGTTTPAAPLDVATANTTFNPTGNSTLRITNTAAAGQSALDFVTNGTLRGRIRSDYGGNMALVAGGGGFYFMSGGDYTLGKISMVIGPNGYLGLGTGAPGAPLDVTTANTAYSPTGNATLRITNTAAAGQSALDFVTNGILRGRIRSDYGGNMALVTNGGGFYFQTGGDIGAGSTSMIVSPTGNVGIGTNGAGHRLSVAGDIVATVGSSGTGGTFSGGATGVNGSGSAVGVQGSGSTGLYGSGTSYGVYGIGNYGVYGAGSSTGVGVYGAASGTGYGVYGTGGADAGYFNGNVQVTKSLASGINNVTFSPTPTFDCSLGNTQTITLAGNVTSSTLTNCVAGEFIVFDIIQNGTAADTFTWPSNAHGSGTISATLNSHNRQLFYFDGSNLWSVSAMQSGT